MANLLPQYIKKDLRKEYARRFAIVGFLSILFILIVSITSLSPTYFVLNAKKEALERFKDSLKLGEKKDSMSVVSDMKVEIQLLEQDTFSNSIPYGVFVALFKTKTDDIEITKISFLQRSKKLNIVGVATTRSSLKTFIDNIEKREGFLPIESFPYSGFSESVNLPFDFSINLVDNYGD